MSSAPVAVWGAAAQERTRAAPPRTSQHPRARPAPPPLRSFQPARPGAAPGPVRVPISRPRHQRLARETTHRLPQPPLSHSGNIAPPSPGRGRIDSPFPLPLPSDIDPPTLSLGAAGESEDLERIRRLLSSDRGPFCAPFCAPDDVSPVEDFVGKFTDRRWAEEARRDQRRLQAARRGRFGASGPSSNRAPMIRRRTATGEEVVSAEGTPERDDSLPSSPPYGYGDSMQTPDRPGSAASMTSVNSLSSEPLMKLSMRDFRRRDSTGDDAAKDQDGKAARTSRLRPRLQSLFSRKSAGGKEDDGAEAAGRSKSPEVAKVEGAKKPSPHPGLYRSSSSSLKLKNGERPEPFQHVQRRAEERSARCLSTRESRDGLRESRPPSAASVASIERRKSQNLDRTSRHSRIPTANGSPVPSRPPSSQDRRAFSLISSTSERRPLRGSPSSASLRSPSSPHDSLHRRTESSPNPSPIDRSRPQREVAQDTHGLSNGPSPSLTRSESAPLSGKQEQKSTAPSDQKRKDSSDDSEKGAAATTRTAEPKTKNSIPPLSVKIKRNRGNSVDSFLGRGALSPNTDGAAAVAGEQALATPTLDEFVSIRSKARQGPSVTASPLYDRSTGRPKTLPKPRSSLEDDDDGFGALEDMIRRDGEYQELLDPAPKAEDDDTFLLLASSKQYEPQPGRTVRSKAEALAGDRTREREKNAHNQLMNRLKTLHLELRSARRGIDYIERRLNGVGSSDEGEWVDDDDSNDDTAQRFKTQERTKSVKPEVVKQRQQAKLVEPDPPAARPLMSKLVKWGTLVFQLTLLWFLLETYLFYKSFPPSVSTTPIYVNPIPAFGYSMVETVQEKIQAFFRSAFWKAPHALFGMLFVLWDFVLGLVVGLSGLFDGLKQLWWRFYAAAASAHSNDVLQPVGSDFIVGP